MPIRPLRIEVPEADLEDLRARLRRTRWPDAPTVGDWSQGVPRGYLQELCAAWADDYDWRRVEARINAAGSAVAQIDGLGIHHLHVRSPHADALPLIITHGWPGSIVEFLGVLDALTDPPDPADAFHVVIPSLPGYGFSDKPAEPGWGVLRIAAAWAELMAQLGYERFGAQGGDWGGIVTQHLPQVAAERLVGIHLTIPIVDRFAIEAVGAPTPEEERALAAREAWGRTGRGYSAIQSTRPQTLGYGLADSPAGQLAWIVEKFHEWTDRGGRDVPPLDRDVLLDNVTLYWLTNSATSSARLYWESFGAQEIRRVEGPAAVAAFPYNLYPTSRRWAEHRFPDLRWYHEAERGGHFAALEQPELFVDLVRAGFRAMR